MRALTLWTFVLLQVFLTGRAFSQSIYSEADRLITIRTIGVLPASDNVNGIYSRATENFLIELFKKDHHFDFAKINELPENFSVEAMEDSQDVRTEVFNKVNADALLTAEVLKNPNTLKIKLSLYLAKDKSLLLQQDTEIKQDEIENVKQSTQQLVERMFNDLPYQGLVLSRQGTKVTLNLGKKDGLEDNQVLSVVQILKLKRHPKFNFIVSSEKETIGKIKVLKVDDTLSFGRIITEKESGIIQTFSKISGIDPITYSNINSLSDSEIPDKDPSKALNDELTYGENPNAWLPQHKPTFGKVTGTLGLGYFNESITRTSSQDLESDGLFPFFHLKGEAWITSEWSAHMWIRQGFFSVKNPVSGGSPSDLSRRLSSYDLMMGYNFRLGQLFKSPRIEILAGYGTYRMYSDNSNPTSLTTKEYSGFKTGVSGSFPVDRIFQGDFGAELYIYWFTDMSEKPSTSGNSDNDITHFSLFAEQNWRTNLRFRYDVNFELYNSNFTGGTASSSSQMLTNFNFGLAYYF